jgi:hypothetical protein
MKNKDQIFLENVYSKILEGDEISNKSQELLLQIESELSSSPVGKNILDLLDELNKNYNIKDLVDYLNQQENWVAKDNLIQILFRRYYV